MKQYILSIVCAFLFFVVFGHPLYSQRSVRPFQQPVPIRSLTHPNRLMKTSFNSVRSFYKSKADWQHIIDSTWGPGLPTDTKLSVFDNYWNLVDQTWGGFPNLIVNWDSLKNVYRPLVAAGVSRGRFYGILCRLTRALNEWHVYTIDQGIDSSTGYYGLSDPEYPNYPSFRCQPTLPFINFNALLYRTNFGAGLTPLPDSTALVYSVMPNHPLNLQPGDVIMGYNGVPWRQLIRELLDAELPMLGGGSFLGSTLAVEQHVATMSVGMNWGLFDTIDVVKYSNGDTLHLPTSLLTTISPPYHIATEQLAVKGVPFPDIQNSKMVSWGVVEGTSTGYIYIWDWWGGAAEQTQALFTQAIDELIHQKKVHGLLLDFRINWGGSPEYANIGFSQLFNFDPTSNYSQAIRVSGTNHNAFRFLAPLSEQSFVPTPELFDYPIAVLTGPLCGSAGDYNAFRLRFHPMVRFFGKSTAGAYTAFENIFYGTFTNPYFCRVDDGSLYSNYNNEGYLIHKPFPVDEEVWLTRDGVAKGEDDVVKRAIEWISTLTYAHDISLDHRNPHPGQDSICITATLANPLHHAVSLNAVVTDGVGVMRDSVFLFNDGLHGDGSAGDSIWGCRVGVPIGEDVFKVSVQTDDITQGTFRRLPNASQFTTSGPLTLDSVTYHQISKPPIRWNVKPYIRNNSITSTIHGASVNLICNDPWITVISPYPHTLLLSDIPPGGVVNTSEDFFVAYNAASFPGYMNLKFEIAINGFVFWTDSTKLTATGVKEEKMLPLTYELRQNYPNPFNPITTIQYQIPQKNHVTLKVFDVLGRDVAILVNDQKPAGTYTIQFDGSNYTSGVYFYRLQAGAYVNTKKFLLLK
jgi:hypothetical protein